MNGKRLQDGAARDPTPVSRGLLLTLGETAHAAAHAAHELSRRWLGCEPPLLRVHLPDTAQEAEREGNASQLAALAVAVDVLAGQPLVAALADADFTFRRWDAVALWLIVSLPGADAAHAADGIPVGGPAVSPTDALRAVAVAEHVAWQRARLRVEAHMLLLSDVTEQDEAARWMQAWLDAGRAHVHLAGPVSHEHVRLDPTAWCTRLADSMAALLWGAFPSHAEQQGPGEVRVVGAAAWVPPLAQIKQWLTARSAGEAAAWLRERQAPAPSGPFEGGAQGLALPAVQAEAWAADLRRAQPAPPPLVALQVAWPALRGLPQTLAAAAERQRRSNEETLRRARAQWLERYLTVWDAGLAALQEQHLSLIAGLPQIAVYTRQVDQLLAAVAAEQAVVDTELDGAAARLEAAQRRAAQADAALRATCARFPPGTLLGWALALVQPWQWPGWAYAWLFLLPHQVRDAQRTVAELDAAERNEADWHAVRQALLALQQSVRQRGTYVAHLDGWLQELAAACAELSAALEQECAPWTAPLLEQLWGAMASARVEEHLLAALAQRPLTAWAEIPAERAAAAWAEAFATAGSALDRWNALDCLAHGVTGTVDPHPAVAAAALAEWLAEQFERAVPLWPQLPTAPRAEADTWLLLPRGALFSPLAAPPQQPTDPRAGRGAALFDAWADQQPGEAQRSTSNGEALAVVRRLAVPLADLFDEGQSAAASGGEQLA